MTSSPGPGTQSVLNVCRKWGREESSRVLAAPAAPPSTPRLSALGSPPWEGTTHRITRAPEFTPGYARSSLQASNWHLEVTLCPPHPPCSSSGCRSTPGPHLLLWLGFYPHRRDTEILICTPGSCRESQVCWRHKKYIPTRGKNSGH